MQQLYAVGGLFGPLDPSTSARDDTHSEASSSYTGSSSTGTSTTAAAPVSRAVAGAVGVCDAVDFVIPSADALPFTLAQRPGSEPVMPYTMYLVLTVIAANGVESHYSQSVTAAMTYIYSITVYLLLQVVVSTRSTACSMLSEPDVTSHATAYATLVARLTSCCTTSLSIHTLAYAHIYDNKQDIIVTAVAEQEPPVDQRLGPGAILLSIAGATVAQRPLQEVLGLLENSTPPITLCFREVPPVYRAGVAAELAQAASDSPEPHIHVGKCFQ
eukprot:8652-Heterococcus_DN1.PRE.3